MDAPHRKRMRRFEVPRQPRFITFSTYQRVAVFTAHSLCLAFAQRLDTVRRQTGIDLLAWVLMPEHAHLLLAPYPDGTTVERLLHLLKMPIAKQLSPRIRVEDPSLAARLTLPGGGFALWQRGGGYDRNLCNSDDLIEKIEYIHANPVRRGLCAGSLDWEWSSARWYAGDASGPVRIDRELVEP